MLKQRIPVISRNIVLFLSTILLISPSIVSAAPSFSSQIDTPFYEPGSSDISSGTCSASTTTVTSDHIQTALNFLLSAPRNLTLEQAAGVIGNLEQESGQGLNPVDQQSGSTQQTPIAGVGFGIAQWTDSGRQQGLIDLAQQENGVPGDLNIQLDYLWQELSEHYSSTLESLRTAKTAEEAENIFVGPKDLSGNTVSPLDEVQRTGGYENPGQPIVKNRIDYANKVVADYGGSGSTTSSNSGCGSVSSVDCSSSSAASDGTSGLSQARQNVVCLAQQELARWKSQPGYPWSGENTYSESGYLKYSDQSHEEWCADFVSWIYNQSNYPFSGGSSDGWRIAGVAYIRGLGQQDGNFHWHPENTGYTPQPGDIAIHGDNHTNIFISSSGGQAQYIGGDQLHGPYPGGSVVSTETGSGYYDNGITGYVTPD